MELFVKEVKAASKVGAPFDDGTFQGPQVSRAQFDKVMKYIDIGKQEGAKVEMGGSKVEGDGYFIQPTIFTNVSSLMVDDTEPWSGDRLTPRAGRRRHENHDRGNLRPRCGHRPLHR